MASNQTVQTNFTAIDGVSPVIKAIGNSVSGLNKGLSLLNSMGSLVGLSVGIGSITAMGAAFNSLVTKAVGAYEGSRQQELKLITIMRQRMGANADMVRSINQVISAQTDLGVVGGSAQKAGAQQLATFLSSADSLKTLIPAMNNLAVQQNGVNVTAESMVGLGNLMGKVMQGQTAALTRVGITFSAAEEAAIKYGTEEQRAATLAQVITNNVGKMNEVFGKTPEGEKVQAMNRLGGAYVKLGGYISAAMNQAKTSIVNLTAQNLEQWGLPLAAVAIMVADSFTWLANGVVYTMNLLGQLVSVVAPFVAIFGATYAVAQLVSFAIAAYNLVVNGAAASTAALSAVETIALGVLEAKDVITKILTGTMAAYRSGTLLASAANRILSLTILGTPVGWFIAILMTLIVVLAYVSQSMGGLRNVVKAVWSGIVNTITGAINIIIDAINLFIGAMNKAASLSNKLFKTNIQPVDLVKHVSGETAKQKVNSLIEGDFGSLVPKPPTIEQTMAGMPPTLGENGGVLDGIKDGTDKTAENTEAIARKMDMTEDEIKDLIAMSEQENLQKWQQNTFQVNITNQNDIRNKDDVQDMGVNMYDMLRLAVAQSKEGLVPI